MKKILLSIAAFLMLVQGMAAQSSPKDSVSLSTGSAITVGADRLKYPSADLRNALTGLFVGLDITEQSGELTSLSAANLSSYNMFTGHVSGSSRFADGSIICVVDDVPVPFSQVLLDVSQVESVTLLTSIADKAKYGPLASDGVIVIKTKKGRFNTPLTVNVSFETGISSMDRTGEWVDGVDYARLNNQARLASGYVPLYDDAALAGFAARNARSLDYPNVDFRGLMIKETRPLHKFAVDAQGGSRSLAYSIGVNGVYEGGYFKIGTPHNFEKINFSSNVTAVINKYMKANVGVLGNVALVNTPNINYYTYRTVPAVAYPVEIGLNNGMVDDFASDVMIYGVSKKFESNYYAALMQSGRFYNARSTTASVNASLDIDLGTLVKGLKSRTYLNFGVNDMARVGKADDYLAYYMETGNPVPVEISTNHQGVKAAGKSKTTQSLWQQINFYETLEYGLHNGAHSLDASATWYLADTRSGQDSFYERQQDLNASVKYSYDNRYVAELVGSYSGSSAFAPGHRYDIFPSAGLAWIASNESVLKDNKVLSFLKLRAQAGVLGANSNVFEISRNLWDSRFTSSTGVTYGPASTGRWFGNQTRSATYTTMTRVENMNLGWEKVWQGDFGFDATLFRKIDISAQYFIADRRGIITETSGSESAVYGVDGVALYENYNGIRYDGFEATVSWSDKAGDFSWRIGGGVSTTKGRYTKVANDLYLYDWQKTLGTAPDALRGYECIGKFSTPEEIEITAKPEASARVGDLVYRDLNNDGTIDANDVKVIGNSNPRLRYMLNLWLKWRSFDLTVIGTGRAFCDVALTNEYYWNGWEDGNYSAFVRDNIGGSYPNLSYVKNTNNFVDSSFWLRNGSYFKIQNVEIGYDLPGSIVRKAGLAAARAYLRGANLLTLSEVKDLDPESLSAGVTSAPLYRTLTAGFSITF